MHVAGADRLYALYFLVMYRNVHGFIEVYFIAVAVAALRGRGTPLRSNMRPFGGPIEYRSGVMSIAPGIVGAGLDGFSYRPNCHYLDPA